MSTPGNDTPSSAGTDDGHLRYLMADSLQAIIKEQSARAAKQNDDGVGPHDAQDTPTRPD